MPASLKFESVAGTATTTLAEVKLVTLVDTGGSTYTLDITTGDLKVGYTPNGGQKVEETITGLATALGSLLSTKDNDKSVLVDTLGSFLDSQDTATYDGKNNQTAQVFLGGKGLKGADGPRGLQGDKGADGKDGAQGPQGEKGADGKDGAQGPQGEKGADGKDGAQGPQGEKGEGGAQGPKGADGKSSSAAEVAAVPVLQTAVAGNAALQTAVADNVNLRTAVAGNAALRKAVAENVELRTAVAADPNLHTAVAGDAGLQTYVANISIKSPEFRSAVQAEISQPSFDIPTSADAALNWSL